MSRYDDPYQNSQNAYPAYQTHHLDPSDVGFQENPSTEKFAENYPQTTERERKGRAGLNQTKSWAEMGPPPRSTGILRMWRKDERGKQWSRFVRPPNLSLNAINLGTSGVNLNAGSFSVNINLDISVNNPNWFNVDFKEITADVKYPGVDSKFGGGTLYNINFVGHAMSKLDFPLALNYSSSIDPNQVILRDLLSKCGTTSGQQVTVQYTLYLKLRILSFILPVTTNSDASFTCPISAGDISDYEDLLRRL